MRILQLYLKALCELSQDGDSVQLVSLNDRSVDPETIRNCANSRLTEWAFCGRNKLKFCYHAFRLGLKADRIICGHVGQLPIAWLISLVRPRASYYLVAHGIEVWRPFSWVERKALRAMRCAWCVSAYTKGKLFEHCALRPDQAAVLPNALDPKLAAGPVKPSLPLPPVILSITRLTISDNYKGIEHLVSAMPAVRAAVPSARLRVVGRGDALPGLRALALRIGLEDAVEFTGYLTDREVSDELDRCRLFALPSEKEGFGLVYLEAMAHGRPCLGARAGGVPEVITEQTGILVDYGDVPCIAAAAIAALNRNWDTEALLARARDFSYPRFKSLLGELLAK